MLILTFLFALLGITSGLLRLKGSSCKDVTPVEYDENWVNQNAITGFYHAFGSTAIAPRDSGGELIEPPVKFDPYTRLRRKMCWDVNIDTAFGGNMTTQMICRFNRLNSESCMLDTRGTALPSIFKFYGDFVGTKTDNRTYIVIYGCLLGYTGFWTTLVPVGQVLPEATVEEILQHIVTLGFSRDKNRIKSKFDGVAFGSMKRGVCK